MITMTAHVRTAQPGAEEAFYIRVQGFLLLKKSDPVAHLILRTADLFLGRA